MSHSVESHLKLHTADYDELILKLVPAYPKMRSVQLDLLALAIPDSGGLVLDLGGGTGALAAAIAQRFPHATMQIWDVDPEMLRVARARCAEFGERVQYVERSFTGPAAACDAVTASLSLHHIKDPAVKGDTYRHIFEALRPSGLFVNADTSVPAPALLRERAFRVLGRIDAPARHQRRRSAGAFRKLGGGRFLHAASRRSFVSLPERASPSRNVSGAKARRRSLAAIKDA